jgi:hypothetical protein
MSEQQTQVQEVQTPPTKVTFSPEQQAKIDELIRSAMGRAGNEAKARAASLEAEVTTLQTQLATLKGDKSGLESSLTLKEQEAKAARNETIAVRKQNTIQAAATEHNFFNPQQVAQLTDKDVQWDAAKGKFIVVGEDGTERLGIDGNPLSVDAYYKEFASKNPHMVRGSVLPGIGSREAQQPPHRTLGEREKLAKPFGKLSDSRAANTLAINNPQEYKRLKREARSHGLIP